VRKITRREWNKNEKNIGEVLHKQEKKKERITQEISFHLHMFGKISLPMH
jgi:hypothetical protein